MYSWIIETIENCKQLILIHLSNDYDIIGGGIQLLI